MIEIRLASFRCVDAGLEMSGWVSKDWLRTSGGSWSHIYLNILDLDVMPMICTTISVDLECEKDGNVWFSSSVSLDPNASWIQSSFGRLMLELQGMNDGQRFVVPIIINCKGSIIQIPSDIEERHKNALVLLERYRRELVEYHVAMMNIERRRELKEGYAVDWTILREFEDLADPGPDYEEDLLITEEDREEEELAIRYKDALDRRGGDRGAGFSIHNGFVLFVHSNDHGLHIHVQHRGRGIDARFSFPEISFLNYKKKGDELSGREIKEITERGRRNEMLEKLEREFAKRNYLL